MNLIALGELVEIKGGGTPDKSVAEYWDGDIPWASVKDFKSGILDKTIDKISQRGVASSATQIIRAGSIIVPTRMAVGKVAINTIDLAINQDLKALMPKSGVDIRFLYHALLANGSKLEEQATGATVKGIKLDVLRNLKIPLPPLEEQKRIAAILDQADALRRLRRRALDRLNTLGQAVFNEMFGDVVTNPNQWEGAPLGGLCEVGSSKRVFVEEFVATGVPFYRGTEVGQLGAGSNIEPTLFISSDHYDTLIRESGKPELGDLLLPSICHDGRIWNVDHSDPFYFKDGRVLWIKSSKSATVNSEYLRSYLRSLFLKRYSSIASGTTFAELKIVNLKSLNVLCPPVSLQDEFSSRITETKKRQTSLERSLSASEGLFASLQHRAFRGEL